MARDTYKYHFKMGNKIVHTGSLTIWIGEQPDGHGRDEVRSV